MKAILTVPCRGTAAGGALADCLPLFPLLDRPFLQHVVEHLADRGVTEVQFVLGRHAAAVEDYLGDGARWGCKFAYHLTRDPDRPARTVRALAGAVGGGPVLLGHADRLPPLPAPLTGERAAFTHDGRWTGWAVADAADLAALPNGVGRDELFAHLVAVGADPVEVGPPLAFESAADVAAAQRTLLRDEFPGVLRAAREVRPGVWLARGVKVSPTAELVAPVFVGEGTAVGANAKVGPDAVVGPGCLVDAGATVRDTTVLPTSYVGPGVELNGVIVDGRNLLNPKRGTAVSVEGHLLDALTSPIAPRSAAGRLIERVAAAAGFVAGLPVLAAAAAWLKATRGGPVFRRRRFVRTPAAPHEAGWRLGSTFTLSADTADGGPSGWVVRPTMGGLVCDLLPGLLAVARGDLRLVGLPPRTADGLGQVPTDRWPAFLGTPAGLMSEAELMHADGASPDDVYLADAFQAHSRSTGSDVRRAFRFVGEALTSWRRPDPVPPPEPSRRRADPNAPTLEATRLDPTRSGVEFARVD